MSQNSRERHTQQLNQEQEKKWELLSAGSDQSSPKNNTYRRARTDHEKMDGESIYREKRLGIEHPELSVGDGVSLKGNLTLIDKELRARLGKSVDSEFGHLLNKAKSEALSDGRTSLHFSSAPKKPDTDVQHPQSQFMSSGEFHYAQPPVNNLFIKGIENIHEDSKEYYTTTPHSKLTTGNETHIETEMQENFFGALKEVVAVIFAEIQEHTSSSSESVLQGLMLDKNKLANSKNSVLKRMTKSKVEDLLMSHESLLARIDAQLGEQMQKTNLLKRLLIELLMFLDLHVLGMSKVRKLVYENKHFSDMNSPSSKGKDFHMLKKSEEFVTKEFENVTESWVDKHSLLQAENKQKLQKEMKRLSANQLGREGLKSLRRYKDELAPTRLLHKIVNTKAENVSKTIEQSLLKNSKKSTRVNKTSEPIWKRRGFISQREYSRRGDIKFYLKTNRKSLFKHPTTNFIAEKYQRGGRRKKKRMLSFLEHKRLKKEERIAAEKGFSKKKTGIRDEISQTELFQAPKRGQKLVQSVCSSKAENMTDSNIFFIKTSSGHQIKVKKCLEDAKMMLEEFKFDLASKQGTIQRNKESIAELASSVERLRLDVTLARDTNGDEEVQQKEIEIKKKEKRILDLQAETSRFSEEVVALSGMIVQLKRENESNLDEVTRMVKSKFKEIESRNRKERQVQRDLVIRFNLELEAKNDEIDHMISQYQELRLLNQDLSTQLQKIKRHRPKQKNYKPNIKKKTLKQSRQLVIRPKKNFKKVKSTLVEKNMTSRSDMSPDIVTKDIEGFKDAVGCLREEVSKQGKSLKKLNKEKNNYMVKLSEAERALERFRSNTNDPESRLSIEEYFENHLKLAIKVARRKAELHQSHSNLNHNKLLVNKLIPAATEVENIGMRLARSCSQMARAGQVAANQIKRREIALEDQAQKDRHFMKVNQINTSKLDRKNQHIMDLELKNSILKMKIEDLNRIIKARNKSSGTSVDKRPLRSNRNKSPLASSRASGSKTFNRKRLYHNSNKAGSLSSFQSLSKPFSQTLNSEKFKDPSNSKSRPRNQQIPKKKKYDQRIKNSFKTIIPKRTRNKNPRRKAKSKVPSKYDRGVNLYQFMGTRTANLTRVKSLERQLEEMKKKHGVLQDKYAETHNDLLKSKRAMQMEALREKKQSERSLRSGSYQEGLKTISEKKETNSNSITHGSIHIDPRKSDQHLGKHFDVSGIYKTVIEELNISSRQSRGHSATPSSRKLKKINENLKTQLTTSKNKMIVLQNLIQKKMEKMLKWGSLANSYGSRLTGLDDKLHLIQAKLAFNASELKESMNLFENNLGEEVKDKETRRLQKKLNDKTENLAIAKRNLAGLNKVIEKKEQQIADLEAELETRPAAEGGAQELVDLRKKVGELETKKKNSEEQIAGIQGRFKTIYDQNKELKNKVFDLENNMEALEKNIAELRRVKEEKEKLISDYERRVKAGGLASEGDASEMEKKLKEERERDLTQEDQEVKRLKSLLTEKDDLLAMERNRCGQMIAKISNYEKELANWRIRWNLHENRALQALVRAGRSSPRDQVSPTSKAIAMSANPGFSFRQLEVKGLRTSTNRPDTKDSSRSNSAVRLDKKVLNSSNNTSKGVFAPEPSAEEITRSRSPTEESRGNLTININNLTVQTVKYLSQGAPKVEGIGSLKESNSEDNLIGHRDNQKKRKKDFKSDFSETFRVNSKEVNQIIPGIEEFSLNNINRQNHDTNTKTDSFAFGVPTKTQNNFSLGGEGLDPETRINVSGGDNSNDNDFETIKKQSGVGLFKNEEDQESDSDKKNSNESLPGFGKGEQVENAWEPAIRRPSITVQRPKNAHQKENPKRFMLVAGDDSNLSDESSSLGSLIQSRSNNNSKENNSLQSGKRKMKPNPIKTRGGSGTGDIMNNSLDKRNQGSRGGTVTNQVQTGYSSSGNLIMTGNSVISVVSANNSRENQDFENESQPHSPKITKSLFVPRTNEEPNSENQNSFNAPSEKNFQTGGSDFDGFCFEAKREEDSDVFSAKEDNVFEVDQNLHQMMKHEAAVPGMDVITFSRRYITGETEEEKSSAIKKQEEEVKKKLQAQQNRNQTLQNAKHSQDKKDKQDKNMFDMSFNVSMNVSHLNGSDIQTSGDGINMYPRAPMPASGGNISFGGSPPLMFDSNTSMATGGQVLDEDLMRDIQMHAAIEKEKKILSNSGVSPRNKMPLPILETVIEEEIRLDNDPNQDLDEPLFEPTLQFSNTDFLTIKNVRDSKVQGKGLGDSKVVDNFFTDQVDIGDIINGLDDEKKKIEPKRSLVMSMVFDEEKVKDSVLEDADFDFGKRLEVDSISDSDDDFALFTPKKQ